MNKILIISILAAFSTGIAGLLHISMLPLSNMHSNLLFLIGGSSQIIWIIPTIKNFGKIWDYIGITGTIVFVLIYIIARLPNNPITGRTGGVDEIGIIIELFQITFISLLIIKMKVNK